MLTGHRLCLSSSIRSVFQHALEEGNLAKLLHGSIEVDNMLSRVGQLLDGNMLRCFVNDLEIVRSR